MSELLHLQIATPAAVIVDSEAVTSVRAMDASGSFGILPGHASMLTVLPTSVVEWMEIDGRRRYCAVRGGVLSVSDGAKIAIASRSAVVGASLDELESVVLGTESAEIESNRQARVKQTQLHAQAVRHLVRYLVAQSGPGREFRLPEDILP